MRNPELSLASDRTPVRLGRYEIVQKLGSGGMADVYLAHQPGPFSASKLIVIKQLRSGVMDDEQFVHMFADESRIAVRLNHPNVVQTYEAVAEGRDYYLVLEYLDGKSLHQIFNRVSRSQMPLTLHLWVLTQVLAGLHYAHELKEFDGTPMGIVHRDVSPSNVFITHNGEVKLLDFGIAKSVGAIGTTREGIIKGKLGYAAPEQCLCKDVDRRTDLFAVGVMLWEAIAGCKRPMGETDASTYQARVTGTETPIEQAAPKAPVELVKICNHALERQPEKRFQTALEFGRAIERFLTSAGWSNGTEQLRAFMHDRFAAEIEETRRRIDEHLGKSRSMGGRPLAAVPALDSLPPNTHSANREKPTMRPEETSKLAAWLRRPAIVGAGAAACLTAIAAGVWLSSGRAVGNEPSTQPLTSSPASTSAIPAAPQAAQITLVVTAKPDSAEIRLDGRRISNPYRAAHGRDNASHHLAVSMPGFETSEQDIQFDRDLDLAVALTPIAEQQLTEPRPSRAQVLPSVAARSRAINATANPAPGDALRSGKKSRKIDESAPF